MRKIEIRFGLASWFAQPPRPSRAFSVLSLVMLSVVLVCAVAGVGQAQYDRDRPRVGPDSDLVPGATHSTITLLGWGMAIDCCLGLGVIAGMMLFLPRSWKKTDKLREALDANTAATREAVRQSSDVVRKLDKFTERLIELHAPPGCPFMEKTMDDSDAPLKLKGPNL